MVCFGELNKAGDKCKLIITCQVVISQRLLKLTVTCDNVSHILEERRLVATF